MTVSKIQRLVSQERSQYLVFASLSSAILGIAAAGQFLNHLLFRRFTGAANPVLVAAGICLSGVALLPVLLDRGLAIYRKGTVRGLLHAAAFAALFGSAIIVADLTLPALRTIHPRDMNVSFPASLLFYPVIGFMVEIVFHVLPLALLLLVLQSIFKTISLGAILSITIPIVAALEPTFQAVLTVAGVALIGAPHAYGRWAVGFDWVQIFVINVVQLLTFRRYDFLSMYSLRLVYYLIWHVVWGPLRLGVVF